eukprot:s63_g38.t1
MRKTQDSWPSAASLEVLTSSSDRTARLWDLKTGSCERVLSHNGPVVSASFSPTGGQVLTASSDRTARLWSSEGDALQKLSGHSQVFFDQLCLQQCAELLTAWGCSPTDKVVQRLAVSGYDATIGFGQLVQKTLNLIRIQLVLAATDVLIHPQVHQE